MNVDDTASAIDKAAGEYEHTARQLRHLAAIMRTRNDLTYASEAITTAVQCLINARLDLLVTRPIREMRVIASMNQKEAT